MRPKGSAAELERRRRQAMALVAQGMKSAAVARAVGTSRASLIVCLRTVWFLAAAIVLCLASAFLSLSRGGMIAILAAGALTAVVIGTRRGLGGHGWVMAALAIAAFGIVLYLAFDAVYDRLATLQTMRQAEGGRWQIVKDIAVAWTRFPIMGTGLGTHEFVYPMFDRSTIPKLAAHAENEYAQAAEETGIAGLGLLLVLGAMVWGRYARCLRGLASPVRSAALGLGFALAAVMVHSFSDFGQHLPANASLSAVFCGLLVCLPRIGGPGAGRAGTVLRHPGLSRVAAVVCSLLVVVAWATQLLAADAVRRAEAHWEDALRVEAVVQQNQWLGTNEDYRNMISSCASAAAIDPENIKYRYWLNVYRWNAISRVRDRDSGQIVVTPKTLDFTRRIVGELHLARALCPTFGPLYCLVGQLEMNVLSLPGGAAHIRTGCSLAPCDPIACYVAGELAVAEGKPEEAMEKLRRAVTVGGQFFNEGANLLIFRANRPDLAIALADDDPDRLLSVGDMLQKTAGGQELAKKARAQGIALLQAQCRQSDVLAGRLARLAGLLRQEKEYAAASECYRRALAMDYGQVGWRMEFASVLAEAGQAEQAIHEARICLRLKPDMTSAKKLIAHLSVKGGPRSDLDK